MTPALLRAFAASIQHAFFHLFIVAAVIAALSIACSLGLKEVPLRGRELKKTLA
jgi:hypothetical protein